MMEELRGELALITGASAGIGAACAEALASRGVRLILGARRLDRLEALAAGLRERHGVECRAARMDVSQYAQTAKALAEFGEGWQEPGILINCAGLSLRLDKIQDASIRNFDVMNDTNFRGVYNLTHLLLPGMMRRNRGHIVNIGSIAGSETYQGGNLYCASKAAVRAFTRATKLDVFGSDVRVTLIEPGMTETEFTAVRWRDEPKRAEGFYEGIRALQPEDVADTVLYCLGCPAHVNICEVVLMPTHQASAGLIDRNLAR